MSDSPPAPRGSRGALIALLGLLALGLTVRLFVIGRLPVVHDEIVVISYGLTKAWLAGGDGGLLFDTPITASNGITPLWWWVQALPAAVFGVATKPGLRVVPLLLGLLGVWAAFRAGRRLFGVRAAWFAGLLYAVTGLVLFVNARGEFAESLIGPALLLLVVDLAPREDGGPVPWRAAGWPAVILFAYLGKGLPIWGVYVGFLITLWFLACSGRVPRTRLGGRRLAALVLLPVVPSLAWMLAAQSVLFRPGVPVVADVADVESVFGYVWTMTAGYGTEIKTFMVGRWYDALYPYTDFAAWPTLCLLAVPVAAVYARSTLRVARGLRAKADGARDLEMGLLPLWFGVPLLGMLLVKGALGARFHLLYLFPLLPYAAWVLDRWLAALESRRRAVFVAAGCLTCAYVAWTATWIDRPEGTHDWARFASFAVAGSVVVAALSAGADRRGGWIGTGLLSAVLVVAGLSYGPADWATEYAWEPGPRKDANRRTVDSFPPPRTFLALETLRRLHIEEMARAGIAPTDREGGLRARDVAAERVRPLLWDAIEASPEDEETLVKAGLEIYRHVPADRAAIVDAWRDFAVRHPDAASVQEILGQ